MRNYQKLNKKKKEMESIKFFIIIFKFKINLYFVLLSLHTKVDVV